MIKMIYQLVIISFLETSALTHSYSGWSHGQYSSYAQGHLLWEWHGYGQDSPTSAPQYWFNDDPHRPQQWHHNEDNPHQPQQWYNKEHNPHQQQQWHNHGQNVHQLQQWYNERQNVNIPPPWTHENYNLHPNQQWSPNNQVSANNPVVNQNMNQQINTDINQELKPPNTVNGNNREGAPNQQALQSAPMYNKTHNPCTREIVTPNFNTPGRRISEAKCMSYIWEIKEREDRRIKSEECRKYRREYLNITEYPVIGGRSAEPGEFPHMVALGWKAVAGDWIFKCGATIISQTFVVTVGHCTRIPRDARISNQVPEIVRIGAKNLQPVKNAYYPRDIKIVKIISHPNYKPPRQYFDIALMQVQEELGFDTNVQPACLWHNLNTDDLGTTASASGWGVTTVGGKNTTSELQVGDLDLINNNVCDQLLRPMCNRYWCGLQEHQICAGKLAGGVDACQGDSGGPLQVRINLNPSLKGKMYYLLGVTSFGFGCAKRNSPGVYTRIASVIDWIEQNVWSNETSSG